MTSEKVKKLGKLSLAILENFVKDHLGEIFIQTLKEPFDWQTLIVDVLKKTEDRFVSEYPDKDLSKAMFIDLSQRERPELSESIRRFYENPTRSLEFSKKLCEILFSEFRSLSRDRVEKAVRFYLDVLVEELGVHDESFRNKIQFLSNYRNKNTINHKEKIKSAFYDFSDLIKDKSVDFIGRENLFELVELFISSKTSGYFFVTGEPGIGKTSFLARFVQRYNAIHHFNSLTEGRTTPKKFYENVCAQLIVQYSLPYDDFPDGATDDARFFLGLLKEISDKNGTETKIVIAVDAVDEVSHSEMSSGANALLLPKLLPQNVFLVLTSRVDPNLNIECEFEGYEITKSSIENQKDIHEYLLLKSKSAGLQEYLKNQKIEMSQFIDIMKQKSEGNFMYLRYVLPELEAHTGAYNNLDLTKLPQGLRNYYEDHWRRMKGKNLDAWFRYKLPVIMALSVSESPMSIPLIAKISGLDQAIISEVIFEWKQFLTPEEVVLSHERIVQYRFYHLSFIDFLYNKEQVAAERVDFSIARQGILNHFIQAAADELDD